MNIHTLHPINLNNTAVVRFKSVQLVLLLSSLNIHSFKMTDLMEWRRGILRSIAVIEGLFGSSPNTLFAGLATTLLSKCEPQPSEESGIPEEAQQVQGLIDCLFPGAETSNLKFVRRYSGLSIADLTLLGSHIKLRQRNLVPPGHIANIPLDIDAQISSIPAEELQSTSLALQDVIWAAGRTSTLFNVINNLEAFEVTTDPLPDEIQQCNGGECGICYNSPTIGTCLIVLPCRHWYCEECIWRWLFTNPTCPACRRDALPVQSR